MAKDIRYYIDQIYSFNREVIFYSDYIVFDLGQINCILEKYGHLPIYLKDDDSYPSECIDYTTYINGIAKLHHLDSSNNAFKILNLPRKKLHNDHDTEKDMDLIMDNVLMIENYILN